MSISISTKITEVMIFPDGRMDTRNAALYLALSEKTLAMLRCQGTGPKFLKRGRVFYFKSDLDDWLNAPGRYRSTAQAQQARRSPKATGILAD